MHSAAAALATLFPLSRWTAVHPFQDRTRVRIEKVIKLIAE